MNSRRNVSLLITCEHGGNEVPVALRECFRSAEAQQCLASHRGYDPGALDVARQIATQLQAPLEFSTISRLVVDLNRSLGSPQLFSKFIPEQDATTRDQILAAYYHPYRQRVHDWVARQMAEHRFAIHLSVHTFTPRYRGKSRLFEMGILFDPQRQPESGFCDRLIKQLNAPRFRVFANQPYLGIDDGLTTMLRTQFQDDNYAGIEIELNNRIDKLTQQTVDRWCDHLVTAIRQAKQMRGK